MQESRITIMNMIFEPNPPTTTVNIQCNLKYIIMCSQSAQNNFRDQINKSSLSNIYLVFLFTVHYETCDQQKCSIKTELSHLLIYILNTVETRMSQLNIRFG